MDNGIGTVADAFVSGGAGGRKGASGKYKTDPKMESGSNFFKRNSDLAGNVSGVYPYWTGKYIRGSGKILSAIMHSGSICAVESQNSDKAVAPEILSDRNGSCAGFDFPVCLPVPDLWTSVLMKFLVSICDLMCVI